MFSFFKKKKESENNEKKEKNENKYQMKIILLGDGGKTSLINRFIENKFSLDYMATISKKILY